MTDFKPIQYYLEVCRPASDDEVLVHLVSSAPFLAISAGDILNFGHGETATDIVEGTVKAVRVEHYIWEGESHIGHKVCVFTKEIEDTAEKRVSASS